MLSPKMQRSVRVNDAQLLTLAERAQYDHSMHGLLHKRSTDNHKWQLRWFILYQNLLFYYETETSSRPSGLIFLEGSYCERLIAPNCISSSGISSPAHKVNKEEKLQTDHSIFCELSEGQNSSELGLRKPSCVKIMVMETLEATSSPHEHCFSISYRRENQRQYDLKAANESECATWILAIREASFNKLLLQKEELEQKHVHLLQVVESEKTAKWQYTQQCEELASEIKKLRAEICSLRREYSHRPSVSQTPVGRGSFSAGSANADENCSLSGFSDQVQDSAELRKIKKVQSFFRGWLCRRRWKQIVEEYIKSPHAESMRKRNSLVFSMVEAEEEYMEQLEVLVSCFYRPFKMAASSKRPPCSHEDLNSIFLNCETVLFLHQIFLKGLTSRLESWPTLVLGDLFDMLLPMLSIYQEYVRNHHYSLQVLTECKVNNAAFAAVLKRLEAKAACQGRCIETFLTYPMHQIPRYIITLHELLAHTPHDHVERKSLQNARQQLEDLSRQMHDEVSETENLRKNLAVERMIVEGCDILLDVNQVFVRQGSLVQVPPGRGRLRSRLTFKCERESVRQCFLFSNNLIIATRTSGGRLHLLPEVGKILLAEATLIEDPSSDSEKDDEDADILSQRTQGSTFSVNESVVSTSNRDFKILVDLKSGVRHCIHLVASTVQEKEAWISDISQCMDNIHLHSMLSPVIGSSGGSIAAHHALKTDPRLFKDDVDIRFSRTLNSCKLPQVRYATPERLLQRLTDLRFLSIDFLNTFLLTYRVFTDSETVLNALKKVFYDPSNDEQCECEPHTDFLDIPGGDDGQFSPRRTPGASSVSGYCSEGPDRDRSLSQDSASSKPKGKRILTNQSTEEGLSWIPEMCGPTITKESDDCETSEPKSCELHQTTIEITTVTTQSDNLLSIPSTIATSSSLDTLTESTLSGPSSPSNLSSVTLVGSTGSGSLERTDSIPTEVISTTATTAISTSDETKQFKFGTAPTTPLPERIRPKITTTKEVDLSSKCVTLTQSLPPTVTTTHYTETGISLVSQETQLKTFDIDEPKPKSRSSSTVSSLQPHKTLMDRRPSAGANIQIPHAALCQHRHSLQLNGDSGLSRGGSERSSPRSFHRVQKTPEKSRKHLFGTPQKEPPRRFSESDDDMSSSLYTTPRGSLGGSSLSTMSPRASIQQEPINHCSSKVGVVITSYRQSQRSLDPEALWSSTSTAAAAFAIATSASSNPRDEPPELRSANRKDSVVSSPATMRVLNVLRHWVSKHFQDFEQDVNLRSQTIVFLEDITCSPNLLPSEHRAASQLLRLLVRDDLDCGRQQLELLLTQPLTSSKDSIETLSALEIAEQMTYLDHQIFINIRSEYIFLEATTDSALPCGIIYMIISDGGWAKAPTALAGGLFYPPMRFTFHPEFLGQSWMKSNKKTRAEHIIQMTKRFNDGSRLVSSEIISRSNISSRVAAIEKWTAVADICRCLHNFNGVLQVCAAFTNAAVFRLKKTWDKVPKTIKHTITKLQAVICSDGRFRAMREALHRCDPPCIPYLGMYLTDLSFIEEGTPDFTQDRLLNFSKMRMVAHVIREIRHFQQTPYKIEHIPRVTAYLFDSSLLLDDDELYSRSLQIEPRSSRLSAPNTQLV